MNVWAVEMERVIVYPYGNSALCSHTACSQFKLVRIRTTQLLNNKVSSKIWNEQLFLIAKYIRWPGWILTGLFRTKRFYFSRYLSIRFFDAFSPKKCPKHIRYLKQRLYLRCTSNTLTFHSDWGKNGFTILVKYYDVVMVFFAVRGIVRRFSIYICTMLFANSYTPAQKHTSTNSTFILYQMHRFSIKNFNFHISAQINLYMKKMETEHCACKHVKVLVTIANWIIF